MALSHEDKKDVKGALGKAMANKISKVTRDSNNSLPHDHPSRRAQVNSRFMEAHNRVQALKASMKKK